MNINVDCTQLWVTDQDEALAFYTEKLGMEVRSDVSLPEMGGFRWLVVGPPDSDVGINLMAIPGEPVMDGATGEQVRELVSKGFAGTVFLTTDDCRAPTRSSARRESSSPRSRRSGPTEWTPASATPSATRSGSPRSTNRSPATRARSGGAGPGCCHRDP